jgi:AcrR family transcriptional regulator
VATQFSLRISENFLTSRQGRSTYKHFSRLTCICVIVDGMSPATQVRRRTQAERRELTRTALLDAAVECLIEEGYAAVTTRRVAERAGVSQGAQQHYFDGRVDMVVQAVGHLSQRLAEQSREQIRTGQRDERRRMQALLDRVWDIHTGPAFQTAAELWAAARTDLELRGPIENLGRDLDRQLAQIIAEVLPTLANNDTGRTLLDVALATARGLALRRLPGLEATVDRRWRAAKSLLMDAYNTLANKKA